MRTIYTIYDIFFKGNLFLNDKCNYEKKVISCIPSNSTIAASMPFDFVEYFVDNKSSVRNIVIDSVISNLKEIFHLLSFD